jgi:glycosyltransferase involved in cell wall biosynthesis
MASLPKITIVTPSYNQGNFIEETIVSVISQGYPNLEYIIIDGGSTDNTVEIIKKYEEHLSYWVSEKDKGQSEAINKGFERASGDVINWLNSDDYYEPGVLLKVGEAFLNKSVNVFCGRSKVFGNGESYLTNGTDVYADNLYRTIGQARIDQPETFFRFSRLKEIGFVNESLHFIMDKELWIRYLLKFGIGNVVKSKDSFVNYRLHDTSKTVSLRERFAEETRNLYYTFTKKYSLENFTNFFQGNFDVKELSLTGYEQLLDAERVHHIVNYYMLEQAMMYYAKNDYPSTRNFIKHINANQLSDSERQELAKIQLRMKVPVGFKNLFHFISKLFSR